MLSHLSLGATDLRRGRAFYVPVMAALGWRLKFETAQWIGWMPAQMDRPLFIVTLPENGAAATVGNGGMVAFDLADRGSVRRVHALALTLGGRDAGAPGLRPQYHADYFGAYVRDPDGNKLCLCCHAAAAR